MKRHLWLGAGLAGVLVLGLTACAGSSRDSATTAAATGGAEASGSAGEGSGGEPANPDGQIVFGAAGAPSMFDPLYATDGETFRVARQMNEGLVGSSPGPPSRAGAGQPTGSRQRTARPGRSPSATGVKFHDGTPVDAAAVCFNLDRMYTQTGAGATQAQYWSDNMGGFKDQVDDAGAPVPSVYSSPARPRAPTAVIALTTVTSKFPAMLGLPSFSIQSPDRAQAVRREQRVGRG